ncbi:MAG: HEAT repeat domain-containing protein [Candidatus Wallbacteria bacterium]|nr:HEAT repeat domain-containing protein [Candidatus Wallbacteria bacterium]
MSRTSATIPFLGLPRSDLPRFGAIAVSLALTQCVALLVYLASTTLFLQRCGAKVLPWTSLAGYLLALALSALFRRMRGTGPFALMAGYFACYCVFLGFACANGSTGSFASYTVIQSIVVPFPVLCWMLFWNSLEGALIIQEVKLWTPLVTAIAFLGQVLTGLVIGPLGRLAGLQNLYLLGAAGLGVAMLCLRGVAGQSAARGQAAGPREGAAQAPSDGESKQPLLGGIARLVAAFAVFKYLVDYQLNQAVAARYTAAADVAAFLGRFDSLTKATIFFLQTGLTGRLLGWAPPGRVLAAMPVLLGLASAAVLSGGSFSAILAANLLFTIFDKGINKSCLNLLLAPFPPEQARQARLRLDGLVYGSGVVVVSIAMIALPGLLLPVASFAVLLALSVLYFLGCLRIDERYVRALESNLLAGSAEERASALARLRAFSGRRRVEALRAVLASAGPEKRRQAAVELARSGDEAAGAALCEALESEKDSRVQASLIALLPSVREAPRALEPFLDSPDPRVRANAVEAVAVALGTPAPLLVARLSDPHPRVRSAAAAGLVRRASTRALMTQSLGTLRGMLRAGSDAERAAACWALGRIGHPVLIGALSQALVDPELPVRRQAALALERAWAPTALPALHAAAQRAENSSIATELARAIRRLEDRTQSEVLWAMGRLERAERQALAANLSRLGQEGPTLLARILSIEDPRYRARLAHAARDVRSSEAREALALALSELGENAVSLVPVLRALVRDRAPSELWRLLERLRSSRNVSDVAAAAHASVRELARLLAEPASPGRAVRRQTVRAARLLAATSGDPSLASAVLAAAARRDRRRAGLTIELLEKRLPDGPLRRDVSALLEASFDPAALHEAARRVCAG